MLYAVGALRRVETLTMLTVSDIIGFDEPSQRISDDDLRRGVDDMMRIACQVAVS